MMIKIAALKKALRLKNCSSLKSAQAAKMVMLKKRGKPMPPHSKKNVKKF